MHGRLAVFTAITIGLGLMLASTQASVAGGASSNLRASLFENAAVLPSSRLIVGRPTSTTGLRFAAPCFTRCLNKLDSAARRRRTVEDFAPCCSLCMRSQAMTAR